MHRKTKNDKQLQFLAPSLSEQLNPKHPLYLLAAKIDWQHFEKKFSDYYSNKGRPAHPIRKMVALLILKSVYNLSDEKLVEEHWEMNAYFQYFTGEQVQQWGQPCAASDLVHFRQRIGEQGIAEIFKQSIDVHGADKDDTNVSIDTTVQEKNITYPTDAKLHKKIIDKCVKKSKDSKLKIRRSYKRTAKQLVRATQNSQHPSRRKKANSAKRQLKTIAGRLVRELERLLPDGEFASQLALFKKVLAQEKNSKNKIYSLHEPDVYCMSKGKAHKQYEFGCKGSLVLTQNTGIIVGAMTFKTNKYDGHTLEEVLAQTTKLTGKTPKTATVDRGYKGKQEVGDTKINIPKPPLKKDTAYAKNKKRKFFRRRAAIEPTIGHLKSDHRANLNYLKGQVGDSINFMMAAAGFNFKKLMNKLRKDIFWLYLKVISYCNIYIHRMYCNNSKSQPNFKL